MERWPSGLRVAGHANKRDRASNGRETVSAQADESRLQGQLTYKYSGEVAEWLKAAVC